MKINDEDDVQTADATPPEEDRQELFRLDDERVFYVPRKVGPNVSIAYLRDVKRHGETYATAALMERMLGEEAMDALAEYDDLTEDELERIGKIVQKWVFGSGPLAGNRADRRKAG